MRDRYAFKGRQKLSPHCFVLGLRRAVVAGFALFAQLREYGRGRQCRQGVTPIQIFGGDFSCLANLLQQRQLARLVMVATGLGLGVFVFGSVVGIKLVAFKAAGNPVRSGNHPLQKRVGSVVCCCGIDERVSCLGVVGLQLAAVDKWMRVTLNQIRGGALHHVKRQSGVGGMFVGVVALLVARAIETLRAILGDVSVQRIFGHINPRALSELTQVVQVGGQGHAAGGCQ